MPSSGARTSSSPPAWQRGIELILRALGPGLLVLVLYLTPAYAFRTLTSLMQSYAVPVLVAALLVGVAAAAYWTWTEARRATPWLHRVLQATVRYFLAYIFVTYGLAKIYRTQLYEPFLIWQDTPAGALSGFALTWTFFGSSYPYTLFIGFSQIACALLLLFRRTQLVGALMLLPIVGNIVVVNFAYDIPVKLNATIFLVMTAYLVLAEAPRLKAFFWDQRAAPAADFSALSAREQTIAYRIKGAVVLAIAVSSIWTFEVATTDTTFTKRPVYGIWAVDAFELSDAPAAAHSEAPTPWTQVIFEAQGGGRRAFIDQGETLHRATYTVDTTAHTLTIEDADRPFTGTYRRVNEQRLILEGRYGTDSLRVVLTRTSPSRRGTSVQ
jgi:hypothetical protein